jgi:organic radical activating enzyme
MKIIKIENECKDTLEIEFVLGNVCNYKCHYCFPGCNEGTHRWPDIDKTISNIKKLFEYYKSKGKKNFDLKIIGGETTLWPDLVYFIEELKKDTNLFSRISTNASRTLRYWEENSKFFNEITISVHNEYTDLNHIISVADVIHKQETSDLYVYVMMDPLNWNKSLNNFDYLYIQKRNWFLSPQAVLFNGKTIYSNEQKKIFENLPRRFSYSINKTQIKNISMMTREGNLEPYDGKKILLNNANRFLGYKCNIGVDRIYIDIDSNIRGACGQILFDGDLYIKDNNFSEKIMTKEIKPAICQQKFCSCGAEIALTKELL